MQAGETAAALLERAQAVDLALGGPVPFTLPDTNGDVMVADETGKLERWLSLERVADITSYSVRYVREAVRTGELPAERWGRSYRVREADLLAWVETRRAAPVPDRQAPGAEPVEASRARRRKGGDPDA